MADVAVNEYGFSRRAKSKRVRLFRIGRSLYLLEDLIGELPSKNESIRAMSYEGGFSSISFIAYVAQKEIIRELAASTLRIGRKQFEELQKLSERGLLEKCSFVVGSLMKEDKNNKKKYDYFSEFEEFCKRNSWEYSVAKNHSKLILMKTDKNYYVLETSSNLNENPKIEQFCFENDEGVYEFYKTLLDELMVENEGLKNQNR